MTSLYDYSGKAAFITGAGLTAPFAASNEPNRQAPYHRRLDDRRHSRDAGDAGFLR